MTGQPAASSAVPKRASPPPRTQPIASATQINSATPNAILSTPNKFHPTRKNRPPHSQQKTKKSAIQPPQNLFRLERTPILCFHTLNTSFNRTHVSVRTHIFHSAPPARRAPKRTTINFEAQGFPNDLARLTSDNAVPAMHRVLASRFQSGYAGMSVPHHAVWRSDPSLRRPIEDNHENLRDGCDS